MKISKAELIERLNSRLLPEKTFIPGESYVPVSGSCLDENDLLCAVSAVLDAWLTEGHWTQEFIKDLRHAFTPNMRFAVPANSGSSANLLAISALCQGEFGCRALKPGDEVITSAVGFPTTLSGILQNGLVPVLCDVDFPTYNVSAESVDAAISEKTKAIVLPHTMGNPFDLDGVRQVADENNLFLISDSCDSLGATYAGESVGTVEDLTTLSFYPAHHITMGEGGAVLTNSPMMAKVVESLRSWGRDCRCHPGQDNLCGKRFDQPVCGKLPAGYDHKYTYARMGYNLKITDMQAAVGVSQLQRLPEFVEKRRQNHAYLMQKLKPYEEYFMLPAPTKKSNPSWFGFVITLRKSLSFTRNELVRYLEEHYVGTRLLFGGNLLRQPAFQNIQHRVPSRLYNSEVVTTDTFWIGCHPSLTFEMLDYVVAMIDEFIRERGKKK